MATLQHVYRRGNIFWWRRIHKLSNGSALDVRISLRTFDRLKARNRGAALTASTGDVLEMLNQKIKAADARPTEAELQAIARAAYGELLAQICDEQRRTPQAAEMHSLSNRAHADFYQRLIDNGGHASLLLGEEERLALSWGRERVERLKAIVRLREEEGGSLVKQRFIDRRLLEHGYQPHDGLRDMVERALYPAYRDACRDAEAVLQGYAPTSKYAAPPAPVVSLASPSEPAVVSAPGAEAGPCMTDFIEQAIVDLVVDEVWDEKSGRQARSTVALFELLIGKKPFVEYTQADFAAFKRKIRCLPERYDMTSPKSRAEVLKVVAERETDPEFQKKGNKAARSNRTRNRHISSLRGIYRWAGKNGLAKPAIDFENLFVTETTAKRGRDLRPATTKDDVSALFALPVFTGCQTHAGGTGQKVLKARFTPGDAIIFDAFYWVPLLLYYTGARREEICKLGPADVHDEAGIPYIWIDFTEFGRLKNAHSIRPVPLHSELLRLGFLEFARECRRREYAVLFPELRATNDVQNFGDVYYKNIWSHLKKKGGLTSDATVHGMRHRFSSDLKAKKVFSEFRRDLMGQAGANVNEEIYSDVGPLNELKATVEELPPATSHLRAGPVSLPPRAERRPQPAKRRRAS